MAENMSGKRDEHACVLGVDVGGTSIKAGIFTLDGTLEDTGKVPTGAVVTHEAFQRVSDALVSLVRGSGREVDDVVAVGLDVPGPVDSAGRVGVLPNIKLDPDGLLTALSQAFPQAQLAFVNDANAAAMGELWKGSGKDFSSFVMVTLGTGVGGGVVINGRLVAGAFGAGGEIGHITVQEGEPLTCGCGRHGCLEQYASAKGMVRLYKEACADMGVEGVPVEHETDTLSVFKALAAGDKAAEQAIATMCDRLGFALAQISAIVDPEAYLIGGGVSAGFDQFGSQLATSFRSHCLSTSAAAKIVPCSLGNEAGMYGVAYAALQARADAQARG